MKFSGISFGGISGGTTIYSPHYKLTIGKNRKTKQYQSTIRKKSRFFSSLTLLLMMAIPLDLFYYLIQFNQDAVSGFLEFIYSPIIVYVNTTINGTVTPVPELLVPIWIFDVIGFIIVLFYILFIYFFAFKGVATWHGCEHKLIASAEKDDVENMRNHSRINDRCGGCYIFTIYTYIAIYWLILFNFFNILVPVGMLTSSFLLVFIEAKYFHKYNIVGIKIGRFLQDKLTTREPLDFQVDLGIKGMKELIEKEKEYGKQED